MKLYELANDYLALLQAIENEDLPEEAIADTLEAITGEIEDKADGIACVLKSLDAEIFAIKTEEQNLAERRKAKENAKERLKQYLADTLLGLGIDKVETARNRITFRKSESVEVDDGFILWAAENKAELLTFKEPTANKTEIKKALKNGAEIPGARIVSSMNLQLR
jgi:hypothetical protein